MAALACRLQPRCFWRCCGGSAVQDERLQRAGGAGPDDVQAARRRAAVLAPLRLLADGQGRLRPVQAQRRRAAAVRQARLREGACLACPFTSDGISLFGPMVVSCKLKYARDANRT